MRRNRNKRRLSHKQIEPYQMIIDGCMVMGIYLLPMLYDPEILNG